LKLIVAMDMDRGIGKSNALPWKIKSDLSRFKRLTTGCNIIMGRKTYESIGRQLPDRNMIVISKSSHESLPSLIFTKSIDEAKSACEPEKETWVIGGQNIYEQFIEESSEMHITVVKTSAKCDAFFPEVDSEKWKIVEETLGIKEHKDEFETEYLVLKRVE